MNQDNVIWSWGFSGDLIKQTSTAAESEYGLKWRNMEHTVLSGNSLHSYWNWPIYSENILNMEYNYGLIMG